MSRSMPSMTAPRSIWAPSAKPITRRRSPATCRSSACSSPTRVPMPAHRSRFSPIAPASCRSRSARSALVAVGDAYRLDVIDADGNIVYRRATATSPLVGQVVGLQVLGLTGDNTLTATVTGLAAGHLPASSSTTIPASSLISSIPMVAASRSRSWAMPAWSSAPITSPRPHCGVQRASGRWGQPPCCCSIPC